MSTPFDRFFPTEQQVWTFKDRSTNLVFNIDYKPGPVHEFNLLDLPPRFDPAFFDRMTLTPAGLELNRFRLIENKVIPIVPPLVVTPDVHKEDHVAVLFPAGSIPLFYDQPPISGTASEKVITDQKLQFKVTARAHFGEKCFRLERITFEAGRGIVFYGGDLDGVFFVFDRQA